MDNQFCSPLTYKHFNDLNYCPNPQCNNSKQGLICLNSNDDTNIINKYDWAVKSHCEKFNCAFYLCKLCSNLKSPLRSKSSFYNHHYIYIYIIITQKIVLSPPSLIMIQTLTTYHLTNQKVQRERKHNMSLALTCSPLNQALSTHHHQPT